MSIQKVYGSDGSFIPAFSVSPEVGLAALDVEFADEQLEIDTIYQKEYTGTDTIQKEYL